jgi:cell division transport system permease protein
MRLRFVMSETGIGLRRNLTMTIAVVLVVAISLTALGWAWLVGKQINAMKDYWFDKIQVSVFLTKDVTQPQRDAILAQLHSLPQVETVYYESSQQAYQRAQQLFKDQPSILSNIHPDTLPESYRVKLYDPRKYLIVSSAVQNLPGVDQVQGRSKELEHFFKFLGGLQKGVLIAALVALAATVLLIFNTVRLSAFSRRRETGIMRLVGASDAYIQAPFVLEGATAGLLGAVLSGVGCVLFKVLLIDHGLKPLAGNLVRYITWGTVVHTVPYILILGIVLAGVTSFATLQRYLRV